MLARLVIVALLLLSLAVLAAPPPQSDEAAIRAVVQAQIEAFADEDAGTAFSYASPGIQARFGDPSTFMAMVMHGYPAVFQPRTVQFMGLVHTTDGRTAQRVLLMDGQGRTFEAIYPMEQQDDGSWRIDGCLLKPAEQTFI